MCKRNEMLGSCLMALGAGMLISMFFRSDFILCLLGLAALIGGLFCCRQR